MIRTDLDQMDSIYPDSGSTTNPEVSLSKSKLQSMSKSILNPVLPIVSGTKTELSDTAACTVFYPAFGAEDEDAGSKCAA